VLLPEAFGTGVRCFAVAFPSNFRAKWEACHKMSQNATSKKGVIGGWGFLIRFIALHARFLQRKVCV